MLAEYVYLFAMSALITVIFLGGWLPPFDFLGFIPGAVWFSVKFTAVVFVYIWLRSTLPRFRVDRLMEFGWKVLFPVALANIFLTALIKTLFF
jgi:NADH-quinone oxidoreductase subunit H